MLDEVYGVESGGPCCGEYPVHLAVGANSALSECVSSFGFHFPFSGPFSFGVVRFLGCQPLLISVSSMSSSHFNVRFRWDVSAGGGRLYFMYDLPGRTFSASVYYVSPVMPLYYVLFCSRVFGGGL